MLAKNDFDIGVIISIAVVALAVAWLLWRALRLLVRLLVHAMPDLDREQFFDWMVLAVITLPFWIGVGKVLWWEGVKTILRWIKFAWRLIT